MFNVGGPELLVILLVALIVLGPQRLPEAARTIGRVVAEVRRISTGFQDEVRNAFEDTEADSESSVPLAEAVTDASARSAAEPDDTPDGSAVPTDATDATDANDEAAAAQGSTPTVAPAVADALDEILGGPTAPDGASDDDQRAAS